MDAKSAATAPGLRLVNDLSMALVGQGPFAPGRAEARQALAALHDGLVRKLREVPQVALLAGRPSVPLDFLVWGVAPARQLLEELLPVESRASLLQHLAGSWRDRRLLLLSLQAGVTRQEFDLLFHLLAVAGDRGLALRKRYLEEKARGNLPFATLLFVDDLRDLDHAIPWPVQVALAQLLRDLNLLSLAGRASDREDARRRTLLDAILGLVCGPGELREFLAHLDLLVDELHHYNRDEFAYLLLDRLELGALDSVCLELCTLLERLQLRLGQGDDAAVRKRVESLRWITRRLAEQLMEGGNLAPAHYHALVLQKVLLYEEIPGPVRGRVAALQVLTSFLVNPQRYFAEIEGSHNPEILEKRLWRLLEMLPNMLSAGRFDAAREVVGFSQRFGPTFELSRNAGLLNQIREAAAEVLAGGEMVQQADLMKALAQMGRSGLHLLIDLADHPQRAVRRVALDGLCASGPSVVPVLFETMGRKSGWHYLRNMLVILAKVGAGGPKVEAVYRQGIVHPEAAVRKEALPALARLLRENAADPVAEHLDDPDPEVRRRAVVCLGMTGVAGAHVYERLAGLLAEKDEDGMALAIVGTLNRLRPGMAAGTSIETALIALTGGGWFGIGKPTADRSLRIEAIRALGQFSSARARKSLERLARESDAGVALVAREALAGTS